MHHAAQRSAETCGAQHFEHVEVAFAGMDYHGQIALLRKPQVAIEIVLLHGKWRIIPMAIQPGFADGHHDIGTARQFHYAVPFVRGGLGRVVWLNADGGEQAGMTRCQADGGLARWRGDADRYDRLHARFMRPGDYGVAVGVEFLLIQMSVSVDQWHDANREDVAYIAERRATMALRV